MIAINHLTKRYGNKLAVDDLSFTVEAGQQLLRYAGLGFALTCAFSLTREHAKATDLYLFPLGVLLTMLAVLADSPSLARRDMEQACAFAHSLGMPLHAFPAGIGEFRDAAGGTHTGHALALAQLLIARRIVLVESDLLEGVLS